MNKLIFFIILLFVGFYDSFSQNNWKYISQENFPTFYFSSIETPNDDIIVLENNYIEIPEFKSGCNLIKFNNDGKIIAHHNINNNESFLYCTDLLKHHNYFLLIGVVFYHNDSLRNDLFIRRYDYDFNMLDEKIYPSRGYPALSMRTKLINEKYYVSSINTQDRTTKIYGQSLFKIDTLGNLLFQKEYLPTTFMEYPYDFVSDINNGFIGISGGLSDGYVNIITYNDSLTVLSTKIKYLGINASSNFIYFLEIDSDHFLCYWLNSFIGIFDIGLTKINYSNLTPVSNKSFGTSTTDDFPTFNRGIQKVGNDDYYISGRLNYGNTGSFDTSTIFVSRLDSDLNTKWIRMINLSKYVVLYNNLVTSDSGILINGMVSVPFPGSFLPQGCLLKIGKDGEFGGTTSTVNSNLLLGVLLKKFDDHLEIEIQEKFNAIAFTLLDIQGKEIVPAIKLNFGNNKVELPKVLTGVYPFKFFNSRGIVYQGKLLINK